MAADGRIVTGSFGGSVPWFEEATIGVALGPPGPAATLVEAWPSPFNPTTTFRIDRRALPAGPADFSIYDIRGRLVRTLLEDFPAGEEIVRIPWDGTDRRGVSVPSGVYFGVFRSAAATGSAKAILLR